MTDLRTTGADPAVKDAIERGNAVVFLDVAVGADDSTATFLGRIKLELFVQDCPKTAENFRQFCTGEYLLPNEQPAGYKVRLIFAGWCELLRCRSIDRACAFWSLLWFDSSLVLCLLAYAYVGLLWPNILCCRTRHSIAS